MDDLFSSQTRLDRIIVEEADVSFLKKLPFSASDSAVFEKLSIDTKWLHERVFVYGKWHFQPRLTQWYGDPGKSYSYSGASMNPLPWTNLLLALKREVENLVSHRFNSVLLNLYRDQNDRMGFHSDNEPALGHHPVIASLSYGATRTLILKHKRRKDLQRRLIPLSSGSLLLMRGETQKNWNHGIDKERLPCGPRINLTFRDIVE